MSQPGEQPPEQTTPDIMKELRDLGQNVEQAVRSTFESARIQSVQRDVVSGMQEFFNRMQEAAQRFQQNPNVQNLSERGQQALQQAQESKASKDIQETLARILAYSNQQLQELTTRMQQAGQPAITQTQNVPITDESTPPATGPTVRLDLDGENPDK